MKVIEGGFTTEKTKEVLLKDAIADCLEEAELSEATLGQFVLLVNTPDRFTFVTNEASSAELVCLLEMSKSTVLKRYSEEM